MVRRESRQIEGDGLGSGRQANEAVVPAPLLEMTPVGAVGAAAVLGLGGFHEGAGAPGEVLKAGDCPALSR